MRKKAKVPEKKNKPRLSALTKATTECGRFKSAHFLPVPRPRATNLPW